ncbi:prepilin peptidase [Rickettsiales endosymbiont of Stachyamoeba lipophora]|uniref:prepilin peptidase n=1 Tax=Rickettsiales endosymbiont of Stachyamoeba lipophora TaxID=2486578 RepID=UPI0013DDC3BE|nr:A24 family peptidase [Rickettsiales endosymbiont of Stachyamoeba lipophora]
MIEIIAWILLAAVLGSFITMLTHRMVNGEDMIFERSYCPKCLKTLKWYNLIPIISYLLQRGKCSNCGSNISKRYLIIEIATVGIFLFCYCYYHGQDVYFYAFLYLIFLTMIITDLEYLVVFDLMQILFAMAAIIYMVNNNLDFLVQLRYALITYAFFFGLNLVYSLVRKKDGIGLADIKFLGIAALFLTPLEVVWLIFLSGLCGVIFGSVWVLFKKSRQFPFIPCIIISFVILLNKLINISIVY